MPAYNARRLGVMYVIFNGRIWSSYRAGDGWRAYSGGESHADHIHISLSWSGAAKRTSWWTGKAVGPDYGPCVQVQGNPAPPWSGPRATPCPTPIDPMTLTGTPLLARDATGAYVVQLQRLLSVTPVTGFFGPITAGRADRVPEGARPVGDRDDHPGDLVSAPWRRGREPAAGTDDADRHRGTLTAGDDALQRPQG